MLTESSETWCPSTKKPFWLSLVLSFTSTSTASKLVQHTPQLVVFDFNCNLWDPVEYCLNAVSDMSLIFLDYSF